MHPKNKFFHIGRPNLPNKKLVLEKFSQILENGWLTNNGPMVRELEARIQDYLGSNIVYAYATPRLG